VHCENPQSQFRYPSLPPLVISSSFCTLELAIIFLGTIPSRTLNPNLPLNISHFVRSWDVPSQPWKPLQPVSLGELALDPGVQRNESLMSFSFVALGTPTPFPLVLHDAVQLYYHTATGRNFYSSLTPPNWRRHETTADHNPPNTVSEQHTAQHTE
jgi:hypothetical protein